MLLSIGCATWPLQKWQFSYCCPKMTYGFVCILFTIGRNWKCLNVVGVLTGEGNAPPYLAPSMLGLLPQRTLPLYTCRPSTAVQLQQPCTFHRKRKRSINDSNWRLAEGAIAKNTWTLTQSSLVTPLYLLPYMMPSQWHTGKAESLPKPVLDVQLTPWGSTTDQSSTAAVLREIFTNPH